MIITTKFNGDDDDFLKEIQSEHYHEAIRIIFEECKREYLHAERIVGVRTRLGESVQNLEQFDHRLLQGIHDVCAALFRFDNPNSAQLSFQQNHDETPEVALSRNLRWKWMDAVWDFAKKQSRNADFCRNLVESVVDENFQLASNLHQILEARAKDRFTYERGDRVGVL